MYFDDQDGMSGRVLVGSPSGRWSLIVVYSGKHSPTCIQYLLTLSRYALKLKDIGVDIIAVTSDTLDKVESMVCSFCYTIHILFACSSFFEECFRSILEVGTVRHRGQNCNPLLILTQSPKAVP